MLRKSFGSKSLGPINQPLWPSLLPNWISMLMLMSMLVFMSMLMSIFMLMLMIMLMSATMSTSISATMSTSILATKMLSWCFVRAQRHCQKWKLWNYTSMDIKSIENWCNLDTVRKINGEWNHIVNFNRLCTNMNHSMPLCPNKDLHCNTIYGLTQHQKSAKTISGA